MPKIFGETNLETFKFKIILANQGQVCKAYNQSWGEKEGLELQIHDRVGKLSMRTTYLERESGFRARMQTTPKNGGVEEN